jgi:hypothetical protein
MGEKIKIIKDGGKDEYVELLSLDEVYGKGKLVAKVKFWFGKEHPIFNTRKYIVVQSKSDSDFFHIYEKVKQNDKTRK